MGGGHVKHADDDEEKTHDISACVWISIGVCRY